MMLQGEVKHKEKGECRLCCLCSHLEPSARGSGPGFLTWGSWCTDSPAPQNTQNKHERGRRQVQKYISGLCFECCLGLSSLNVANGLNEIRFKLFFCWRMTSYEIWYSAEGADPQNINNWLFQSSSASQTWKHFFFYYFLNSR